MTSPGAAHERRASRAQPKRLLYFPLNTYAGLIPGMDEDHTGAFVWSFKSEPAPSAELVISALILLGELQHRCFNGNFDIKASLDSSECGGFHFFGVKLKRTRFHQTEIDPAPHVHGGSSPTSNVFIH